jgi:hypothetical protein
MQKAFTVGVAVMAGILIGRIQIVEDHEANAAIEASERADKRALDARRDAIRSKTILDKTERKVVDLWRRLDPLLEDYAAATTVIDREAARHRMEQLRREMDAFQAPILAVTAARDGGLRQAVVKKNFGD